RLEDSPYRAYYEQMERFVTRMMEHAPQTASDIADLILYTMERRQPPLRVPATFDAHLFALMRRLLPRGLYHQVLYYLLPGIREWGKDRKSPDPRV
ncbi:MAG: hypothetical protein CVV27_17935, partial [Candidatus Melainabacteria bacterium HGW-Melainabacteria-1]